MMKERDSYYILGLPGPAASEEEVKKAYRNLARKEHPDKAGIGNKKRFQAIQQAYSSILKQRQFGGSVAVPEDTNEEESPKVVDSAVLQESLHYANEAHQCADEVAQGGHRALRGWEESEGSKRRSLKGLRDLTRHSASELRGVARQMRQLGRATEAMTRCAEAFLNDNLDIADTLSTGMALRDRCAIVEDSGRACVTSAELLERIGEATEATLRKVEKASPDAGEGNNLLRLGTRLLTESLARSAAVARRTAEEALNAAGKALDLHRGMLMLDAEARKERERLRKRHDFEEDEPVPAPDAERKEAPKPATSAPGFGKGRITPAALGWRMDPELSELLAQLRGEAAAALEALRALRARLPREAPQLRRWARPALGRACCEAEGDVASGAAELLELLEAPAEKFLGGPRSFRWKEVEIVYWELPEIEEDLLFGFAAWPAAQALARLLIDAESESSESSESPLPSVAKKRVLEVGAGVAVAGLSCRALGAAVCLSDAEERLVEALKEHHHDEELRFQVLDWNTDEGVEGFDVIVGSDLLLAPFGGAQALPRLLARRLAPGGCGLLLNSRRGAEAHLTAIEELRRRGFAVSIFLASSEGMGPLLPISAEQIPQLPENAPSRDRILPLFYAEIADPG
ncbi:unnamed protein product [Effrenium voratum]|uniref:J domain-containing protein n=1 Tax=Effrenium voratum TaxID=2562239 RepID=A0AA36MLX9_9DINO|nr:unnamed protein product [Effrenium voratum]